MMSGGMGGAGGAQGGMGGMLPLLLLSDSDDAKTEVACSKKSQLDYIYTSSGTAITKVTAGTTDKTTVRAAVKDHFGANKAKYPTGASISTFLTTYNTCLTAATSVGTDKKESSLDKMLLPMMMMGGMGGAGGAGGMDPMMMMLMLKDKDSSSGMSDLLPLMMMSGGMGGAGGAAG